MGANAVGSLSINIL